MGAAQATDEILGSAAARATWPRATRGGSGGGGRAGGVHEKMAPIRNDSVVCGAGSAT